MGDSAGAITQARRLHDHVDRAADHFADRARGQRIAAHGDHGFDTRERLARGVGVQRAHRTVMAGVHSLQEVEGFRSAHLAHDDAFRPHTQAVLDQVAHGDLAFAFQIGRARFEAHRVRLLQLQLGGVLAGDDALVAVDELGEAIEQRGLAGAGAAGDDGVDPAAADHLEDLAALGRDGAESHELFEGQLVLLELADGERRSVDGERRHDHVDTRTVGQARVADRRGFVDAAADLADDALADVEELLIVAEADAGFLDLALDFDVGRARAVHHDVGDVDRNRARRCRYRRAALPARKSTSRCS